MFKKNIILFLIILILIVFSIRMLSFIHQYAVNFPYSDYLYMAQYIAGDKSLIDFFSDLYIDNRIGSSLIIVKLISYFTQWNVKFDNFLSGFIIIITSILALKLKRRVTGKFILTDIFIPILFLNLHQYENLIDGYGFIFLHPLLWLFLFLEIFSSTIPYKEILILILVIISTFSSFHGLFIGFIASIYFFYRFITAKKTKIFILRGILLLLNVLIISSYFFNFTNFDNKLSTGDIYLLLNFSAGMINHVIGFHTTNIIVFLLPMILFSSFVYFIYLFLNRKSRVLFPVLALYIFSGLFLSSVTLVRMSYGTDKAFTSHYVSYTMLLYLASYITFELMSNNLVKRIFTFTVIIPMMFFLVINNSENYDMANNHKQGRIAWKKCYLKKRSLTMCQKSVKYKIMYNTADDWTKELLTLLGKKKLSFFAEEDSKIKSLKSH